MIYDDGINTAMITIDEEVNLLSAMDKQGLTGGNKQRAMIENPVITHIGKKTN